MKTKLSTVKTIPLHSTNGLTVHLDACDGGEWHPQTATSEAWGFMILRLRFSPFRSYSFRHRITGRSALDILTQLDGRAQEQRPKTSAFITYVLQAIRNHRANGITFAKA